MNSTVNHTACVDVSKYVFAEFVRMPAAQSASDQAESASESGFACEADRNS